MLAKDLETVLALVAVCATNNNRAPLATALLQIFRHERQEAHLLKTINDLEIDQEGKLVRRVWCEAKNQADFRICQSRTAQSGMTSLSEENLIQSNPLYQLPQCISNVFSVFWKFFKTVTSLNGPLEFTTVIGQCRTDSLCHHIPAVTTLVTEVLWL